MPDREQTTLPFQKEEQPVAKKQKVEGVVKVAVPLFLPKLLDYKWCGNTSPVENVFVDVEVGKKKMHGLVVDVPTKSEAKKLKRAMPLLDVPPLAPATSAFWRWAARYVLSAPGDPLRASLLKGQVPDKPAPARRLIKGSIVPKPLTKARQKVMERVGENSWLLADLARVAGVSTSVIHGLVKQKALVWKVLPEVAPTPKFSDVTLNESQQKAADALMAAFGEFQPFVLDGTMGSGKTEVYFEAIEKVLRQKEGQVLLLVPEISLTPQLLKRFEQRFGFMPEVWHSSIGEAARRRTWWRVHTGSGRVILGARSALFLPFQSLQMLIVDEEHDASYKQEDAFRYHGRDMAVAMARHWQCPVVLASATPSLESWHNVQTGKYTHLKLQGRYGGAVLPEVHLVDLREDKPGTDRFLSPSLLEALAENQERGEQSLLFLNRRGVAPLLICRDCGHRHDCPRCDASLVVHGVAFNGKLVCHHCGFTEMYPDTCSKCGSDKLHPFGPGTRKVLAEVKAAFPSAKVAVADSDSISNPADMGDLVKELETDQIDILIGTQMVAKGHHFPNLTLVGVLDGDMGLASGDLRAAERTFQLLMQVSGRAGRGKRPGRVLLQTHQPEHPFMQALASLERDGFYQQELAARKPWGDPPFGRQVAVHVSGQDENRVVHAAQKLAQNFTEKKGMRLLGPAPAVVKRVNDVYRYRLLVKSATPAQTTVEEWLANTSIPPGVRVEVDVDPMRM